jgi:hypothetical protein
MIASRTIENNLYPGHSFYLRDREQPGGAASGFVGTMRSPD